MRGTTLTYIDNQYVHSKHALNTIKNLVDCSIICLVVIANVCLFVYGET